MSDYEQPEKIDILSVENLPEQMADTATIKLSAEKQREIGARLVARLEEMRQERRSSKWEEDRKRDFNSYHLVPPERALPYAGYPNLACPLPRIGVDTFHANVLYSFGGQNGRFTVLPDYLSKSHMDSADRAAKYLTYVLNYEADMWNALDKADLDAQIYGNGYLEPRYCQEYIWETRVVHSEEVVPEINELTGEVTRKTVSRKKRERVKKCVFDGIKIDRISPEAVYKSPFIDDIEEAVKSDYVFKCKVYKCRNIEAMGKSIDGETDSYFPAAKVKELKEIQSNQIRSRLDQAKQAYDGFQIDLEVERSPIELAEAHFWEDMNDDGIAEKVTVIFETSSGLIMRATYGECRIVELKPRPVEGRSAGESVRRTAQALIREWEAIHNARVAKGQWANLPFFFYKAGGRFNPQTITLAPGKGYPVDDTSAVNFPQMPQVDSSYFNEEKIILDYFERLLALGESMQGVAPKGDTTATETINAQQRAGIRLATPMNRIAMSLNRLVAHIWELNKQCAPELKEFQVAGVGNGVPVFDKITSKDYDVMVDFKLNMSTLYDTQLVRDTALLNYQTFISNPLVMNNPAAFFELTKNTMKAVGLEVNIPKPEQAGVRSPFVEHDLVLHGEDLDPVLGEDTREHMIAHKAFMKSDDYKNWPEDAKMRLAAHMGKTMVQEETLKMGNLNASGIYEGAGPMGAATPGITASRNPSQTMNNLRVEESPKSMKQNVSNGAMPQ